MDLIALFQSKKNLANVGREILKVCRADFTHIQQIALDPYYTLLARRIQQNNKYHYLFTQLDVLNKFFIDDYRAMFGCAIPKDKFHSLKTPEDYHKANMFNDVKTFHGNWQYDEANTMPKRGQNVGNYNRYVDKGGFVEGMPGMREYDTIGVTTRQPYYDLDDRVYDPTPDPRYKVPIKFY